MQVVYLILEKDGTGWVGRNPSSFCSFQEEEKECLEEECGIPQF